MNKNALSLKYRPKKLDDIVGQDVVKTSLKNAFKTKKLHHAFIFYGKFGSGKTSTARIMAAMENCENNPYGDPCGYCDNCKQIFSSKCTDIKEIDAASNRSIDDIRNLQEEIRLSPLNCRTRYVIIDEVHSIGAHAAEAALKMIEEPPPNVRFILCTTNPEALKDTIHSRCINFCFSKIPWREIANLVNDVAKKEEIPIEEGAIRVIARAARGSARNALQYLQATSTLISDGPITSKLAMQSLGVIDDVQYYKIIQCVVTAKVAEAMKLINDLMLQGKNSEQIIKGLEAYIRTMMIIKSCPNNLSEFEFSEEEITRISEQTNKIDLDTILNMLNSIKEIQKAVEVNLELQYFLERFVLKTIMEIARKRKAKTS